VNSKVAFPTGLQLERLQSDAVIIACDDAFEPAGAHSRDIYEAGGSALQSAAATLAADPSASTAVTPGGSLPAKFVIHARLHNGRHNGRSFKN
jgi:O-acetyl-ADP-ribose deacetylase (regulator of RNase III)